MWSRAARGVTPDYTQYGSPLRAAAEMDQKPDILHLFSQPPAAEFIAGQQMFSVANARTGARGRWRGGRRSSPIIVGSPPCQATTTSGARAWASSNWRR